jgi:hypothetical protein
MQFLLEQLNHDNTLPNIRTDDSESDVGKMESLWIEKKVNAEEEELKVVLLSKHTNAEKIKQIIIVEPH